RHRRRGPGVRAGPDRGSARGREPAQDVRAGNLLYQELHGSRLVRSHRERRHAADHEQESQDTDEELKEAEKKMAKTNVVIRDVNDAKVIQLKGKITIGAGDLQMREA